MEAPVQTAWKYSGRQGLPSRTAAHSHSSCESPGPGSGSCHVRGSPRPPYDGSLQSCTGCHRTACSASRAYLVKQTHALSADYATEASVPDVWPPLQTWRLSKYYAAELTSSHVMPLLKTWFLKLLQGTAMRRQGVACFGFALLSSTQKHARGCICWSGKHRTCTARVCRRVPQPWDPPRTPRPCD